MIDHAILVAQIVALVALIRKVFPSIDGTWRVALTALAISVLLVGLDVPDIESIRPAIKLALFAGAEAMGFVRMAQLGAEKIGASMPATVVHTTSDRPTPVTRID
jgi:hypothetical protein